MKTTLISLIALGAFTAAAAADPTDRAATNGPMVLSDAELDRVTAGLLLPAVQAAREAPQRHNADAAPVMHFENDNLILSTTGFGTNTQVGPRLGLKNLARQ